MFVIDKSIHFCSLDPVPGFYLESHRLSAVSFLKQFPILHSTVEAFNCQSRKCRFKTSEIKDIIICVTQASFFNWIVQLQLNKWKPKKEETLVRNRVLIKAVLLALQTWGPSFYLTSALQENTRPGCTSRGRDPQRGVPFAAWRTHSDQLLRHTASCCHTLNGTRNIVRHTRNLTGRA